MNIIISNASSDPIYDQIYKQVRNLIIMGELESGAILPSIRNLARELKISVITTKRAYEELERDGFIATVAGKGSFVSTQNTELLKEKRLQLIEQKMLEIIEEGREMGITLEELQEMLDALYKEG